AGPSGAGKSTLATFGIEAALEKYLAQQATQNLTMNIDDRIGVWKELKIPNSHFKQETSLVSVQQKALHRTITSTPATVLGIMDGLRKHFAATKQARDIGLGLSDFSFNGNGGCESCKGRGYVEDDLFFLGQVEKVCPSCEGKRYKAEVLEVTLLGKNIHQWLSTHLNECQGHIAPYLKIEYQIDIACKLGLGHIPLGMPTSLISGGEAQRLRICSALSKTNATLFCILDEPTRGLSEKDVGSLLSTLLHLTEQGHTFVIVEHHELFERHAHHLMRVGPGSGIHGGNIVGRIYRNF
ncbi:MAG: hypothetical protein K2X39_05915, partial [Silvanigrellaceae bacterium]|nr:hypothetical protein [Silvanigrellaceae bacterium]